MCPAAGARGGGTQVPAGSGGEGGGRFPGGRAAPGGRCAVPGGPLVCTAAEHTLRLLPALCRVVLCRPPRPRCLGSSSRPDPHPGWLPRRRGRPPRRAAAEALPCARQAPAVSTMGWAWFSLNPPPPPRLCGCGAELQLCRGERRTPPAWWGARGAPPRKPLWVRGRVGICLRLGMQRVPAGRAATGGVPEV